MIYNNVTGMYNMNVGGRISCRKALFDSIADYFPCQFGEKYMSSDSPALLNHV